MTARTARTGGAAVAGGLLLAASVTAELAHAVQRSDGSLTAPGWFAGYLTLWTLGAAALVRALLGLRSLELPRIGRIGSGLALAGTVLLVAFGLVVVGSALATGTPWGAAFLAFGVGLLLSAVGSALLGLGLRRSGALGGWWRALLVAAAGAAVALLAPGDPWHDLGLLTYFGAWVVLGLALLRGTRRSDEVPVPSRVR